MKIDEKEKNIYKSILRKIETNAKMNGEEWWFFRGMHNEKCKLFWTSEKKKIYKHMHSYLLKLSVSEMDEEELFTFKHL